MRAEIIERKRGPESRKRRGISYTNWRNTRGQLKELHGSEKCHMNSKNKIMKSSFRVYKKPVEADQSLT